MASPILKIEQVLADGKPVPFTPGEGVVLPAGRHDLEIRFRTEGATPDGWIVQYQLVGYDSSWRVVDGEMAMTARLFDAAGREIVAQRATVPGQNIGWTPVPFHDRLNRRIEPLFVPEGARSMEISFDSGSWNPELTGDWIIDDVSVNLPEEEFGGAKSFWPNFGFDRIQRDVSGNPLPIDWKRDGSPDVARFEVLKPNAYETNGVLTLRDYSKEGYGIWTARLNLPPKVKPGDVLTVGWWERPRVGDERSHSAHYGDVPPGQYLFRAIGRGLGAVYQRDGIVLPVVIHPYVWTQSWFAPSIALAAALVLGAGMWIWLRARYRRRLAWLEIETKVEKDRMRIARDIHDDVGAQLTRLGMMCAGLGHGTTAEQLEKIGGASRQIVQSMAEIVWAIEPSNDSLDRLCTFLCRFADEFLKEAGVRARFQVPASLPPVPLGAEVRHNLFHAVKEAINNAVKHAGAGEVRLSVAVAGRAVEIVIVDDGKGFDPAQAPRGNGLRNMRARLADIGGTCHIESSPRSGTQITFRWPLSALP